MNKLDIIIPVHNESEIIVNLLLQFEKQIKQNGRNTETSEALGDKPFIFYILRIISICH